jgi:ABC-type multidrug transport system ATPase subunit
MGAAVEAVSLWKAYGDVWALRNVSISIDVGRLALLLGPNGAGKSTLIKILCGLLRPSRGRVRVLGFEWGNKMLRRRVGVLLHESLLYEELTVFENLSFYASFYGVEVSSELLKLLGVDSVLNWRVGQLSYGLRRRVDLARALIHGPSLLLLDEPFSGVDESTCRVIAEHIVPAFMKHGKTIIIASHIGGYVDHLPHLRIVLDNGGLKLVEEA